MPGHGPQQTTAKKPLFLPRVRGAESETENERRASEKSGRGTGNVARFSSAPLRGRYRFGSDGGCLTEYREGTRVARASRGIQRRVFLRAAALGLAAPAAFNLSRLAVAAPAAAPKRLLIFHMPHGVPNIHYNPKVTGGDLTQFALDQSFKSILGPLEPLQAVRQRLPGLQVPHRGWPALRRGKLPHQLA